MRTEINQYIVADSRICHGQPTFKGTRIMVWQILDLLKGGVSVDEVIRDYFPQITREAVYAALDYASKLVEEEIYVTFPKGAAAAL
ncbi:MAG: DUF433 domain-containing protein [Candidatus Altiarchaeota archaeon]|nr:DUF433 domain-containing protein [Candidatus Altiarchaeota archaeon]